MERLNKIKAVGNAHFQNKEFSLAINSYEDALTELGYRLSDIKKDFQEGYDTSQENEL